MFFGPCLVSFLLLRRNTMAKPTYKRKHLNWGLTVSELKSITIMMGSLASVSQAWHWSSNCDVPSGRLNSQSPLPVTSLNKANLPNASQMVPLTQDQVFKYPSLWAFLFKHHTGKTAQVVLRRILNIVNRKNRNTKCILDIQK